MDDYISRQAAIDALLHDWDGMVTSVFDVIKAVPSVQPLTDEDYMELRDRLGKEVEFVVEDMISGKGERWGNT